MSSLPDFKDFVNAVFGKANPKKPPLVEVLWLDASDIENGWFGLEEIQKSKPAKSLSVGYLMHKDAECVKLVSLINDTHAGNGIMIPMGMVKKINYLHR
jgi:hypothetical protein